MRPAADGAGTETFEDVYRRLLLPMTRLGHLLTGSNAIGEEVAQDAFLGLRRNWAGVDNPDGYVRRSVVNHANTFKRRAVMERERMPRPHTETELPPELDETWRQLAKLPNRQRAALVMRFYEDLPEDEIAKALDCRPATVRSLVHRGLARLKEILR